MQLYPSVLQSRNHPSSSFRFHHAACLPGTHHAAARAKAVYEAPGAAGPSRRGYSHAAGRKRPKPAESVGHVCARAGNPLWRQVSTSPARVLARAVYSTHRHGYQPEYTCVCSPLASRRKFWGLLGIVLTLHAINTYREGKKPKELGLPEDAVQRLPDGRCLSTAASSRRRTC